MKVIIQYKFNWVLTLFSKIDDYYDIMSLSGWEIAICVFRVISCSLPTCFISSPSYVSVIWFQMWSLSLPYLSILLYTIHTLSCYLKWRSNLKFNTPDFNIHKTHKSCWDNKIVDNTSTRTNQSLMCP